MPKPGEPPSLDRLGERLKAARERRRGKPGPSDSGGRGGQASGLATGMRIATEMVAALAVGVGIGLGLDAWLGTKPWLMILFLVLGAGVAFNNVVRTAKELERRSKENRRAASQTDAERDQG